MKPSPFHRTITTTTKGAIVVTVLLFSGSMQAQVGYDALQVMPRGDSPAMAVRTSSAVPQEIATDLTRQVARIDQLRSGLHQSQGFLRSADAATMMLIFNPEEAKAALEREYAPRFAKVGRRMPDQMFVYLDSALQSLWSEIDHVANTISGRQGEAAPASLARMLEVRLMASVPMATYDGATLTDRTWKTELNHLGMPAGRSINGLVYYRVPGQNWLVAREFTVYQGFFKRASNGTQSEITFGSLRLQKESAL